MGRKNVPIKEISFEDIKKLYNENIFQEGTVKPKVRAAIHFLKHHGKKVVITSINNIEKSINEKSGTIIRK